MSRKRRMNRMPKLRVIVSVVGTTALAGCVLSIEPVIPASEAVFQPELLGTWVKADGKDTATVTRMGETGYHIRYVDEDGIPGLFEGHTGRLGDHLILEVAPLAPQGETSEAYNFMLPGHLLFVVVLGEADVRTATLRVDSMRAQLQRHGTWTPHLARVPHVGGGDTHLVLTGTTAELRTWLTRYLDLPGVLAEETVWRRARR